MPTPVFRSSYRSDEFLALNPTAVHRTAASLALTLMLVTLWSLTHRYRALDGDAELYAVQALARIRRGLANDLFLQNLSQDRYTIFSPLYAWCIGLFGLRSAAMLLTVVFKVWFFAAAWWLARELSNSHTAFLATALLIVTGGAYGAFNVFHYSEDWVTARSMAEALVITALALHFHGWKYIGLLASIAALFVHPLMALPVFLLLVCLWLPLRYGALGAAAGVLVSLGIAATALAPPSIGHLFTVIDADWLEVVRERSQFLFLQLWTVDDWKLNARPFLSLTASAAAISDPRIRKLCLAAMLVAAAGLAVALIAGGIGPIAILLQGQAWRWVWIASFFSVLLLAPTAVSMWRDAKCGPLCAMLMIAAWTFPSVDGDTCVALALLLWSVRNRINGQMTRYTQMAAIVLGAVVIMWIAANFWTTVRSPLPESGRESVAAQLTKKIMGLEGLSVVLVWSLATWIRSRRSLVPLGAVSLAFLGVTVWLLPGTFTDMNRDGEMQQIEEFSSWRSAIPASANVFVVPAHNSADFAWFTLERPSYLTVDQSSGVVFSRATSLEVRRRSDVLLPLVDPDWRLLSGMKAYHGSGAGKSGSGAASRFLRPLTRDRLMSICRDPQLNFVVAKENVGFGALGHGHAGNWRDWYLYDCRRVVAETPAA